MKPRLVDRRISNWRFDSIYFRLKFSVTHFDVIQREPGQPAAASKFTPGVPDANPTTQMEIKKENVSNKDGSRDYYFPEADFQIHSGNRFFRVHSAICGLYF